MARILLVEDDPDVRLLMERVLLDAGYILEVAETVARAHTLLGSASYDLVIADGRLPDGSGLEIADSAKDQGMQTLIISGVARANDQRRHEYLVKPVRPSEVVLAVRRLIGEAR